MRLLAPSRSVLWWSLWCLPCAAGFAQTAPVVVQAESGTRGAEWSVATVGGASALTATTTGAGTSPGTAARVVSYTVTFPAAGTYALYARLWVGPDGGSDDSFFYARDFGARDPAAEGDWIIVNNVAAVGRTAPTEVVDNAGSAAGGVWKWVRLSAFDGGETPVNFAVAAGALTQTFQIGAREDGLAIDRFVFGLADLNFTVANLEAGAPGAAPAPPPALPPFVLPTQPFATGKPKFLGSAYASGSRATNFERLWNQVTPENAGKWGSVENVRDVMNWTELDAAYNFARTHGFPFKLHTIIWGNQQPPWISALPPAEQLEEIDEWIAALAARYPDTDFIDVVNEPFRNPPDGQVPTFGGAVHANYLAALGGAGVTGWDWVVNSFKKTRAAFPNAKLLLNEFSVTNDGSAATIYIQIINALQAEPGNLLDGIGIQAHAFSTTVPNAVTLANLDRIAATGLPIYISELDINAPPQTPVDPARSEQLQLDDYRRIFPLFWEHPAVRAVTLWGYKPGNFQPNAFIMRADDTPRPALIWLQEFVTNDRPVVVAAQTFALGAGVANGALVGRVRATDGDATDTLGGWRITGGAAAGLFAIDAATGDLSVANAAGLDFTTATTHEVTVDVSDGVTTSAPTTVRIVTLIGTGAPLIVLEPAAASAAPGGAASFTVAASGAAPLAFQWARNGAPLPGATAATLTVPNVQPADAGLYTVTISNDAGTVTSRGAALGLTTTDFLTGAAFSAPDWRTIVHPNGNRYSQVLLTGPAATVTADPGKVTRLSYVDLQDDIVQIEFSGAGTMTVTLDQASGPAAPLNYNQEVQYMKGHATILIEGADASTFVSAFAVGRLTAFDPTGGFDLARPASAENDPANNANPIFRAGVDYDGHADLARLVIASPTGRFGGILLGNAAFGDTRGLTGIIAPGVTVTDRIRLHDLRAFDTATPVLQLGASPNPEDGLRITGGDLQQANGRMIRIAGVNRVLMSAGVDAFNRAEPAQATQARFERDGADVTSIVLVPGGP